MSLGYLYGSKKDLIEAMVGDTVIGLAVEPGEENLAIVTKHRVFAFPVEGDCCSRSYWYDAVGVRQMLGGVITKVESIDMPEPIQDDSYEYIQAYGLRVTTNLGVCDLVFRNSSNGYYGGWADITEMPGVPESWRFIFADGAL